MNKKDKSAGKLSPKEMKRQQKSEWKKEKAGRKIARRQEGLARKQARKDQRVAVGYRSRLERARAVELLEEILAGLKAGTISVSHEDQQLSIHPADVVDVRVRARQTYKAELIALRVRWPRTAATDQSPAIKISTS